MECKCTLIASISCSRVIFATSYLKSIPARSALSCAPLTSSEQLHTRDGKALGSAMAPPKLAQNDPPAHWILKWSRQAAHVVQCRHVAPSRGPFHVEPIDACLTYIDRHIYRDVLCIFVCLYSCIEIFYISACIHTYIHTCMHTYMHVYTYIQTHAFTYVHTREDM